jgi:aminoglycoside 2'-N-acetyltransferase I
LPSTRTPIDQIDRSEETFAQITLDDGYNGLLASAFVEAQIAGITLQVAHTSAIAPSALADARALLFVVFDDMADDDWEHALGGMHAIAWHGATIVGHASVIQRRLVHRGHALRTGYVEGVGVHPDWRRRGIGDRMMAALERVIEAAYDIGALGASDEAVDFYEHRGWIKWRGTSSAITPEGIVRTPDEDDGIYVLPCGSDIDIAGDLACDWRDGDVW